MHVSLLPGLPLNRGFACSRNIVGGHVTNAPLFHGLPHKVVVTIPWDIVGFLVVVALDHLMILPTPINNHSCHHQHLQQQPHLLHMQLHILLDTALYHLINLIYHSLDINYTFLEMLK